MTSGTNRAANRRKKIIELLSRLTDADLEKVERIAFWRISKTSRGLELAPGGQPRKLLAHDREDEK